MTAPTSTEPPGGGADEPPTSDHPPSGEALGGGSEPSRPRSDAAQQLVLAAILLAVALGFFFLDSLSEAPLMIALTGVVISVAGSAGLFIGANGLASLLPGRIADRLRPWIFVAPALLFIGVALVVPTVRTVYLAFFDDRSENYLGGENFGWIFSDDSLFSTDGLGQMFSSRLFVLGAVALAVAVVLALRNGKRIGVRYDFSSSGTTLAIGAGVTFVLFALFSSATGVIWNNLWWVFAVTGIATGLGLAVAVLADRVKGESIAKALIFLPMAISFVGASIIWRFVYAFRPQTSDQIGVLNAVWRGLGGAVFDPLQARPWNTFFLIIVLIWGQTGFAMVVLSSAIKGVPDEYIEAARVDGATDSQIFWRIVLPQISSTILVVVTTLIILVMKVFDIVKVMTNGEFGTNVIANEMFDQAFRFGNFGRGAALATVLFLAVLPVMFFNIRRVREEAEL
jgi:ABC-type sugar transport system permease subunit